MKIIKAIGNIYSKIYFNRVITDILRGLVISYFLTIALSVSFQNGWLSDIWGQERTITRSDFLNLYKIIVRMYLSFFLVKLLLGAYKKSIEKTNKPVLLKDNSINMDDIRIRKIKLYHEIGHAVMAELLDIPVIEISLESEGNIGGRVILDFPPILNTLELKKMVMIRYAGYVAEKLYLNKVTDGCMGSADSDIESANFYLRKYILLTDREISLTGYEEEYIRKRAIELSKEWLEETEKLLSINKEKFMKKIALFEQIIKEN